MSNEQTRVYVYPNKDEREKIEDMIVAYRKSTGKTMGASKMVRGLLNETLYIEDGVLLERGDEVDGETKTEGRVSEEEES